MICQPNACRRPMCAPGFVDAPTRGPVRSSAPRGLGGRCRGPGAADGSRGEHVPRGLLAVVRGVVLDEALDELVDGAGLGQAALAGLVGQLVLGEARVALTGLVVGLLALLPLGLGSVAGLLPLGLLGLLGGVADGLLELVDVAPGGLGGALEPVAHGAADGLDLLAGGTGEGVGDLGELAGVLVVELDNLRDEGELPLDGLGGIELREVTDAGEGPELVGHGVQAVLPGVHGTGEDGLGAAGVGGGVFGVGGQQVLQKAWIAPLTEIVAGGASVKLRGASTTNT